MRLCIRDCTVFKLAKAFVPALSVWDQSFVWGVCLFQHTAGLITLEWTLGVRFSQQNTQNRWTAENLQDKDDSRYQRIIIGYTTNIVPPHVFTHLICQVLVINLTKKSTISKKLLFNHCLKHFKRISFLVQYKFTV